MTALRRFSSTLLRTQRKKGTFPRGSMTRNSRTAADRTDTAHSPLPVLPFRFGGGGLLSRSFDGEQLLPCMALEERSLHVRLHLREQGEGHGEAQEVVSELPADISPRGEVR